jgi:hypothetical protein
MADAYGGRAFHVWAAPEAGELLCYAAWVIVAPLYAKECLP